MAASTATVTPAPPAAMPTVPAPPSLTPIPTATTTPTPTATATSTPTPTATPIVACDDRMPSDDDLTVLVSQTYGISRDYAPADLVPLSDYFSVEITLGYPTTVRAVIVEPLRRMIADMEAAGLAPFIISGYRSYAQQAIAYEKWLEYNPDYVGILSAQPGHSEHQLGTTVDFGSPELPEIVGDPEIEFHTYFYQTSEGQWLLTNAQRYGFTLSFTRDNGELTGFFYEPWHYRYVGQELATELHQQELTLTEYMLAKHGEPCVP